MIVIIVIVGIILLCLFIVPLLVAMFKVAVHFFEKLITWLLGQIWGILGLVIFFYIIYKLKF